MQKNAKLYGGVIAFIGALLVSSKAVIVKLAYQYDVDSASLLMLRMLFALPFFLFIAWRTLAKHPGQLKAIKHPWPLLAYGLLGYYIASFFDLAGLQYIDASLERIILFTYPTIVLLLSYFWLKEQINWVQIVAIVITFLGIGLAFMGNISVEAKPNMVKGALMVMVSAIAYAVYFIGSQKMVAEMGTRLYNSLAMMIASFAILVHNSFVNGWNLFDFEAPVYLYGLLMGILSTVIPSFMIVEGIRIVGAKNSSIIGTIGPIATIVLASIILGETVSALQWAGTLVVIGGILFLMVKK
ncbi:MAG: DMT family transporter [Saprospiraceae bacterium]